MWLVISLARLVVVGVAGALGVYLAVSLLQALTPGVDLWAGLAERNLAVAAVIGGAILAIAVVMYQVLAVPLEAYDLGRGAAATTLLIDGMRLLLGAAIGGVAVALSARLYNRLTGALDELTELRAGNVAVGLAEAAVMVGTALLLSAPAASLVRGALDALLG